MKVLRSQRRYLNKFKVELLISIRVRVARRTRNTTYRFLYNRVFRATRRTLMYYFVVWSVVVASVFHSSL